MQLSAKAERRITMQYARMQVSKTVFDAREKSVALQGIFGTVYAPKSRIIGVEEVDAGAVVPHVEFLVPCWVFWKNDANPCQFDDFIEQVEIKK